MEKLSYIPDIEDQIEQVVKTISPDEQSMQTIYNLIEKDLASVLSEVFVDSFTIRPTGSRVSGLQLHSSDLDMNIYFEKRPCKARKCTYRVAAALSESVLFDNVVNLSQPRIPIVKCVHKETGLKCDMNFSFLSGVENDQLIKNYLSVDNKLRSVMLVIKYWAQLHELTCKERGFSKYSLTMMFIFYLQHEHSFPSVYELQENTVPTNI
ncbi:poly(A) RNA polymerase, mitochondrial-like [Harmonia axyridis]|uniref:poly(A) RNA polymerase, mitochondrial-like n=1 Tax=Harmonia axyridis TaxID=115357 RepID=UPI001E27913B|nr:poly(A) RNA polymerase, mitochondrial-like [Harmonia axyridis]